MERYLANSLLIVAISSVVYRFRIIDITIKRIYSWVSLKDFTHLHHINQTEK